MYIQKIFKTGNSNVVTIPKSLMEDLGIDDDSKVRIEAKEGNIVITPLEGMVSSQGVDPKFMKMVDEFMDEHKDVLKKLAKK